jgi:hypothetical protein
MFTTFGMSAGLHLRPRRPYFAGKSRNLLPREDRMYQAPKLERLGTFRELTLTGGEVACGDGVSPFHRYSGTCPA